MKRLMAGSVVVACASALVFAAMSSVAAAASSTHKLVLYSLAEQEQYINNSDSLTRGQGNNPFGNYKDLVPLISKNSSGPFPGDEALFSFNLYTDAGLTKRAGSAIFTCQYNFNKDAYCDASFQFKNGGTMIASGSFDFSATQFALAVTGGYGAYANTTGSLEETPSAKHAEKLSFQIG